MKKNELMNGDIVVTRSGELAVVIRNEKESYLLYQMCGWESLDDYDDDMVYLLAEDEETPDAIMQVYRAVYALGFLDYEDEEPIYERDYTWTRPGTEDRNACAETVQHEEMKFEKEVHNVNFSNDAETLKVIAQQFYGNRTRTTIKKERAAHFLRGYLSEDLVSEDVNDVVLKAVRIPESSNIVVVYDQTQEDTYVNVEFPEIYARNGADYLERWGEELKMHISCEIPEISFNIHTRCFACRMEPNGTLSSLEVGDAEKVMHYFPV